jgi:hypothetical protein
LKVTEYAFVDNLREEKLTFFFFGRNLVEPEVKKGWQIPYDELEYDETGASGSIIGQGVSAIVYKGKFRDQEVAIKVLKQVFLSLLLLFLIFVEQKS